MSRTFIEAEDEMVQRQIDAMVEDEDFRRRMDKINRKYILLRRKQEVPDMHSDGRSI